MRTLLNIALLILAGIFLFFLYNRIKSDKEYSILDGLGEVSDDFVNQPDSIREEIALNNIIYNLTTLDNLESDYIGFEGRKSTQPDYLSFLKMWADTNKLVKLTDHGNAIVKSMAFRALKDKNYTGLKEIFENHLNDKQTYNYHSGCSIEPVPVNINFYHCIYPTLSSVDASYYKQALSEIYRGTYYEFMLSYR